MTAAGAPDGSGPAAARPARLPRALSPAFATFLAALASGLPSQCAVCGAWPAAPVCAACRARFVRPVPRCGRCALPLPLRPSLPVPGTVSAPGSEPEPLQPAADAGTALLCGACLRRPPPLAACFAAVPYAYPWSGLLARFKFQGRPGWAGTLARLLREAPGVEDALARADVLLPVPLAPPRLALRGFNQALQLARALDRGKTQADWLLRLRDTPAQSRLDLAARRANVRGAFALEPLWAAQVRGARVLLVDDVMTSGASLHAAARPLLAAGAAWVGAAVVARTDPPA